MKLITKALEDRFDEIGDQSQSDNPIIVAKFFNPCGNFTWYVTDYDKQTNICFGYVTGHFDEWGTFSIEELENLKLPFGLRIERDIYFKEIRFKELIQEQNQQQKR